MRTIHLLRHAKSDWPADTPEDFDRPLSDKGRREASLIGAQLAARAVPPALVLCSAAKRTIQTWDIIGPLLDGVTRGVTRGGTRFELREDLYLASCEALLAAIRSAPDGADSLMLIGHNPGLHGLAVSLIGSARTGAVRRVRRSFPTGALATIDFEAARWADIAPRAGALKDYIRPKDLR